MKFGISIARLRDSPEQKTTWLKSILALALACCLLLSRRLWIGTRLFLLAPVSDALPAVPFPLDYVWFFSLVGLLLAISILARPRKLILAFICLAVTLSLWDQTRWQ